jgi:uncharacterized phage protein (TIGR02218 family)
MLWSGRVVDSASEGSLRGKLHCEPTLTGFRRLGLTRSYGRACPHVLYSSGLRKCNAVKLSFSATANLSSVDDAVIQSATFALQPDGYYAGGDFEWQAEGGRLEYRGIRRHEGNEIELTHGIPDLVAGEDVIVAAGCAHDLETCDSKFANSANYGGFPNIPRKNPFGGGSVF